jgi:hypothetical protein
MRCKALSAVWNPCFEVSCRTSPLTIANLASRSHSDSRRLLSGLLGPPPTNQRSGQPSGGECSGIFSVLGTRSACAPSKTSSCPARAELNRRPVACQAKKSTSPSSSWPPRIPRPPHCRGQPPRTTLRPKGQPNTWRNTSTLWHGKNDADRGVRTDHSGLSFSPSAV